MAKILPTKPFLLMLYGFPGAGKTYFARQFCENIQAAHLQADRIRSELFTEPRHDKQEDAIVEQLMNYMAGEFLTAGVSVVYDTNAARGRQRYMLRDLARRCHAVPLLVWFQMDQDTAFGRSIKRDRRRADDKYASMLDRTSFESLTGRMQNPTAAETYAVVSGKHLFNTQQSAVVRKLRDIGALSTDDASSKTIKPGMVNLIPNSQPKATHGRVDMSRRNISIR
ncbi:MAG TPA: ATP-binding protein [Candidatus Saccharimonadales bacterium]|nr:ATP-binding protein [Candidatus Saccharimonadales bacterium]